MNYWLEQSPQDTSNLRLKCVWFRYMSGAHHEWRIIVHYTTTIDEQICIQIFALLAHFHVQNMNKHEGQNLRMEHGWYFFLNKFDTID